MRRLAAIPVLVASVGLLAGCAGGAHSGGSTSASSAAAKATPPAGQAPSASAAGGSSSASAAATAQAHAFAHAVNLEASDVPGFHTSSGHEHQGAAEKHLEPELLRCLNATGTTRPLVELSSQDFERGASITTQSVSSQVTVSPTPALAAKELAAIRGGHLRGCLAHYLEQLLHSEDLHGASVGPVTTKQGSPPAPGANGSFGLRFTETLTVRGLRIPFYVDILGFVDGRAEVSLFAFGVPQPFPARLEERLFSLLLERAKAHKS